MKLWLIFWWSGGTRKVPESNPGTIEWITPPTPFGAVFTNEEAAKAAAIVRNAMMITIEIPGKKLPKIEGADWYRQDDEGHPMPVEWRELLTSKVPMLPANR